MTDTDKDKAARAMLAALKGATHLRSSIRVWAISNRIPGWQNQDELFAAMDDAIAAAEAAGIKEG